MMAKKYPRMFDYATLLSTCFLLSENHSNRPPGVALIQVPPDYVMRERHEDDNDPDQRPPRTNAEGGHKKRHAAELYDPKGPGVMAGGGGGKVGGGSGRGSPSLMSASSAGPREGETGAAVYK